MSEIVNYLTGPNGGIMALCFMAGSGAGYGFATRTIIGEAKARIAKLEEKVERLQQELVQEIRSPHN